MSRGGGPRISLTQRLDYGAKVRQSGGGLSVFVRLWRQLRDFFQFSLQMGVLEGVDQVLVDRRAVEGIH